MRGILLTSTALVLASAGTAGALGLDRSSQDIGVIFEAGNYAELSFGKTMPDVTGTDLLGNDPGNVGQDYTQFGLGLKMDVTPELSFALIYDQPFGADISYGGNPETTLLGGTAATLDSDALTAMLRYEFTENFSVHGGVRHQRLDANITLSGLAYSEPGNPGLTGLNGYNVDLSEGSGTGYLVGVAYERPDIALRVALTYFSEVENEFDTVETLRGAPIGMGTTTISSPEAINLDFQTGIAQDTLLFGTIRHAKYSQTIVTPDTFGALTNGASITDIDDGTFYQVGVGRQITPDFAASFAVGYEPEGEDDLVSPLAPTNGNYSVQVGAEYAFDNITVGGGVRYTWLGDARPETGTPDTARATFTDNSALSVGMNVGFAF